MNPEASRYSRETQASILGPEAFAAALRVAAAAPVDLTPERVTRLRSKLAPIASQLRERSLSASVEVAA